MAPKNAGSLADQVRIRRMSIPYSHTRSPMLISYLLANSKIKIPDPPHGARGVEL